MVGEAPGLPSCFAKATNSRVLILREMWDTKSAGGSRENKQNDGSVFSMTREKSSNHAEVLSARGVLSGPRGIIPHILKRTDVP
ncbi:hypothetical protein HPG69_011583 [Diceros bicornis minor]|uniref:Uncharacterized protein n=1 Tax=Diceros bicornis minor TaxID=77932 RepID=A0A7J7EHI5_DICBM|nr:hypothetical protein HPG69_011583 [Diceros bicornis minor]